MANDEISIRSAAIETDALVQDQLGIQFVPNGDRLTRRSNSLASDLETVDDALTRQILQETLRLASEFREITPSLSNYPGWQGISRVSISIESHLSKTPHEFVNQLGTVYSNTLELYSFIEMDEQIASGVSSVETKLDPIRRRVINALSRNLVFLLRRFPSIQEIDDQLKHFTSLTASIEPAREITERAIVQSLIEQDVATEITALLDARQRGGSQGIKAGNRAIKSALNIMFVIGAVVIVPGGVNVWSESSPLAKKAGGLLLSSEAAVTALLTDLPDHIRHAMHHIGDAIGRPNLFIHPDEPREIIDRNADRVILFGRPAGDDIRNHLASLVTAYPFVEQATVETVDAGMLELSTWHIRPPTAIEENDLLKFVKLVGGEIDANVVMLTSNMPPFGGNDGRPYEIIDDYRKVAAGVACIDSVWIDVGYFYDGLMSLGVELNPVLEGVDRESTIGLVMQTLNSPGRPWGLTFSR